MLEMIDLAKKACIPASYVLFDKLICSLSSLIAIKKKNLDDGAMVKKTSKCITHKTVKCNHLLKFTGKTENAGGVKNIPYPLKFLL